MLYNIQQTEFYRYIYFSTYLSYNRNITNHLHCDINCYCVTWLLLAVLMFVATHSLTDEYVSRDTQHLWWSVINIHSWCNAIHAHCFSLYFLNAWPSTHPRFSCNLSITFTMLDTNIPSDFCSPLLFKRLESRYVFDGVVSVCVSGDFHSL
jgi:hypothetical protein